MMNDYDAVVSDTTLHEFNEEITSALNVLVRDTKKVHMGQCKGSVVAVDGSAVHAYLPGVRQGQLCSIGKTAADDGILSEVTAVNGMNVILQPYITSTTGISCNDYVTPLDETIELLVGDYLKGAVVDGLGEVIAPSDASHNLISEAIHTPLFRPPPDAMSRNLINEPLSVGVRSIDALLTIGKGQRMGIFAPAGVGKSMLLGMMARSTEADVVVLGLIGERGREVKEFLDITLGEEVRKRCITVVSTSDRPAIEKVKAIYTATSIAEYFRDQGKNVLLMVDSLTRFARAQRDVSIAAGDHIPSSGFPASVFSQLPQLLERTGQNDKGSITAIYTVLVEDEKSGDVIAEEVKSLLDGHIILSRKLAAGNHYPAIDVAASCSRVMHQIVPDEHIQAAGKLRDLLLRYQELELLIRVGEYQQGEDTKADEAVNRYPKLIEFMKQPFDEKAAMEETCQQLLQVTGSNQYAF